ncbi:MAG: hypothetical protein FWF96_01720, partial [Kiritimatiellaeota bacterium]|nr:hypothetical protein [Kiritimatiellota bacterium]
RVEALRALCEREDRAAGRAADLAGLDTCLRLRRNLLRFLNNTVSFSEFYDPKFPEMSRAGRLYMDGRACDLTLNVADVNAHATLAANSKTCLVYCLCAHSGTGAKANICAAITAGFAETLWVGRNGLFIDREGAEWDATIVKVVENPISIKEAFWAPWKKLTAMICEQVRKLLADRQDAMLNAATQSVGEAAAQPVDQAAARQKLGGAAMASSVAALGIAVGFVATAAGSLASMVLGAPVWKVGLGVVAIILAVSLPSMVIAFFRLRGRDYAPLLNACGWVVNHPIRITFAIGRRFTTEAALPPKAKRLLRDPYADHSMAKVFLWLAALLAVLAGAAYGLHRAGMLDEKWDFFRRDFYTRPPDTEQQP